MVLCGGWVAAHFVPGLGPTLPVTAALGVVAVLMILRPPVTLAELRTIWRIVFSRQPADAPVR
jgi:hypothetical protein